MDYVAFAKEIGFTDADYFDPQIVSFEDSHIWRDACKVDDCGFYGKYWTCPPGVGSEQKVESKFKSYQHGLMVQLLTEQVSCSLQPELFADICATFNEMIRMVKAEMMSEVEKVFMLGMSNCSLCEECTYPHAPCRHPEEMMPCISGHCVNVYRLWFSLGHESADLSQSDFYGILLW